MALIDSSPLNSNRIPSLPLFPPISHLNFNSRLRLPSKPVKIRSFSLKRMLPKPHITNPSTSATSLLMYDPVTLAAFGGRTMGGSSFPSSSWSSSRSYSRRSPSHIVVAVGLSGMGSSLQRDLKRIAKVADTYTPKGLCVERETALALLQHPDYCIYACCSVDVNWGMNEGETRFNQLSVEERAKFNEETLVNMNNIKMLSSYGQGASGSSNEYMVLLMAYTHFHPSKEAMILALSSS